MKSELSKTKSKNKELKLQISNNQENMSQSTNATNALKNSKLKHRTNSVVQ
jgi:hypothetical protein